MAEIIVAIFFSMSASSLRSASPAALRSRLSRLVSSAQARTAAAAFSGAIRRSPNALCTGRVRRRRHHVPPNPPWGRLPLASRGPRQNASSRDAEPGQSAPHGRQRIYVVRPTICRPLIDVGTCAMASSGWISGILPDEVFSGMNERTEVLVAGLRRTGTFLRATPPTLQTRPHTPELEHSVTFARAGSSAL